MKTIKSAFEFSQMLSCVIEENTGSEHFDNQRSGFEIPSFRIHDMIKFGTAIASIFNKQVVKPEAYFSINESNEPEIRNSEYFLSNKELNDLFVDKLKDEGYEIPAHEKAYFNNHLTLIHKVVGSKVIEDEYNIGLLAWLASENTGMSSLFLATYLTPEIKATEYSTPSDFHDFKRCLNLIRAVPLFESQLPTLARDFPVWALLIENWSKIAKLISNKQYKEANSLIKSCHGN